MARNAPGREESVKITDVQTAVISGNFDWVLVKIVTDEGVTGLGEAYWGVGVNELVHKCKPLIIGEDPINVGMLYEKMIRGMSGAGSIGGATVTAISGIELALWDLVGNALNTPISTLFGGRFRDKIRIYADCHAGDEYTPEAYAKKAREVVDAGFTAIKFDLDQQNDERRKLWVDEDLGRQHKFEPYNRTIPASQREYMESLCAAVREEVGPDIMLAMDCHWRYTTHDVTLLAQDLEKYNLMWLEDPVPPENIKAQARVTNNTRTPICTGENRYRKHGYQELIEMHAADIIAPDIPKMGGLLEAKKVADWADVYYIPIAPHNVSSPIGTVAAAHVCASMSNFLVMEYHAYDVKWWETLVNEPVIQDGFIHLNDKPGHGLTLNEVVALAHLKEGTTYFGEGI